MSPPSTPEPIEPAFAERSVIIIEDTLLMAELLALHCASLKMKVQKLCGTYQSGLATIRQNPPDLVIVDISLPDGDGLELAAIVALEAKNTRLIATSSYRDPWTLERVKRSPVHGFVDKNEQCLQQVSKSIRDVFAGRRTLSTRSSAKPRSGAVAVHRMLSDYKIQILSLVGECRSDEEIGCILGIHTSTAQSHRRDIMKKLGIQSTRELIRYAIASGITRTVHWWVERSATPDRELPSPGNPRGLRSASR